MEHKKISHNSVDDTNHNPYSPLADTMDDTSASTAAPPANPVAPVTPPRERLRRKAAAHTTASTPTKKPRGATSKATSPASPKSPRSNYIYLSASTSTKDIESMCKSNLVNELVKNQQSSDDIITMDIAQSFTVPELVLKVSALREALRKRTKRTVKKVKIPIITAATTDSVVTSMTKEVAQATYTSCMRKWKKKVDKNDLNLLSMNDLLDGIFKYRKHLTTKTVSTTPVPPDNEKPQPSTIPASPVSSVGLDKSDNTSQSTNSPSTSTLATNSDNTPVPVTQDSDEKVVDDSPLLQFEPDGASDIDIEDEPIDCPDTDMPQQDSSQDMKKTIVNDDSIPDEHDDGDVVMDDEDNQQDPPPGTFANEPASTKPSQAPAPVVLKQNFPNAPQVTTPSKPKVQSTNADQYTTERNVEQSAFPTSTTNPVKSVDQRIVSVRAKFFKNYLNESISTLAKFIIVKVREADPSMSVIPASSSTNDEIDNEEVFPEDDDGAKKYMTGLFQNHWVKKFTLRFKVIKKVSTIKNLVIPYMMETKNYAAVDQLSASKICCIGFLSTLHPDLHNRDNVRRICETHVLATRQREVHLSVLPRGISHGKNVETAESRVIVIDVATSDAQVVSDALMEKDFFEYASGCRFIPFLKTKKTYSSTLAAIIKNHAELMKDTQRLNIPDLMLETKVQFTTEDLNTVKKILLSANDSNVPLIHDIDVAPNGSTNIMYYIEHDSELEAFIRNIPTLLAKYIVAEDVSKVYKNTTSVNKLLNQRRVTNNERKFWDEMEQSLGTNPQDPEAMPSKPTSNKKKSSYAAAISAGHTQKTLGSVLPQDKRLINMEHSVTNIQKDYVTKAEVESIVQSHAKTQHEPPSVTPDSVDSMINIKLESFRKESAPALSEVDVQALIDKATQSSESLLSNSKKVQNMIESSISKFRDELKLTHGKLAKSILAVTTTTTNLSASITALQEQNKELSDLFFEQISTPAISPKNEAGANAE